MIFTAGYLLKCNNPIFLIEENFIFAFRTKSLSVEEKFLIDGISTRNKVVFDFIFHYYYSGLCAYAERITGDEKAAEDIVQDLFVSLWIKHKKIKINSSLRNYLFISVKNRSLDFIKERKIQKKNISLLPGYENNVENLSNLWFAESELDAKVQKSLEKLPPRCRNIFKLSRFEGLKNKEIAYKLGISKRTVELQVSNALRQLKSDLQPYILTFLILLMV